MTVRTQILSRGICCSEKGSNLQQEAFEIHGIHRLLTTLRISTLLLISNEVVIYGGITAGNYYTLSFLFTHRVIFHTAYASWR